MIEITTTQAVSTLLGALSLGIGIGYKIGSNKNISSQYTHCDTPPSENNLHNAKSIKVEKVFYGKRCIDMNCVYLQTKKICSVTNTKCKYL